MKETEMKKAIPVFVVSLTAMLFSCSKSPQASQAVQQAKTVTPIPAPELSEGEMLYRGSAPFANTNGIEVIFILSADKKQLREFAVKMSNLSGSVQKGSVLHQYIDVTATNFLANAVNIDGPNAEVSWGNGNSLVMEGLGGEEITGTLHYVYTDTTNPADPVELDLGSSGIILNGINSVQNSQIFIFGRVLPFW
jgi:hypothetical protein